MRYNAQDSGVFDDYRHRSSGDPLAPRPEPAPFGPGESPRRICCFCREWIDSPECERKCGAADARRDERKDRRAEEGA